MAQQLSGASLPQHSTFAHSKEDVLGALSFYFGQPASPEKLKDFNEHQVATYHFPDAYAGSNSTIRDVRRSRARTLCQTIVLRQASNTDIQNVALCSQTINNLIERSPQNWHTQIGLPFRRIEGTVVEWDEIRFDVRLMQRVRKFCQNLSTPLLPPLATPAHTHSLTHPNPTQCGI